MFYLDVIFSLATHRQDWFFQLVIFILYYFKTIFSAIKINPIRLGKILAWPLIVYKIWSIYLFIFWVTPLKIYNLILFDAKMRASRLVLFPLHSKTVFTAITLGAHILIKSNIKRNYGKRKCRKDRPSNNYSQFAFCFSLKGALVK